MPKDLYQNINYLCIAKLWVLFLSIRKRDFCNLKSSFKKKNPGVMQELVPGGESRATWLRFGEATLLTPIVLDLVTTLCYACRAKPSLVKWTPIYIFIVSI